MNFREFTAKTLDEAIDQACSYFNTKPEFIKYEVLKKNKINGIFGTNEVVIKAKPRGNEEEEHQSKKEISKTASEIKEVICNVLQKTGYEYRINIDESEEEIKFGIFGPDMKGLIQEDGVGIDSIKHLVCRMYTRENNLEKRVQIDINDFRKEKETYIQKLAHRLSNKAKRARKEVLVNSMNAYDRRIFHLEVEKIDGVTTESIGDGQYKKIKLIPS